MYTNHHTYIKFITYGKAIQPQWYLASYYTYTGVMFDSLGGLDSTVGGVAICDAEEAGVVARGVDVFLASGVSVPTHGRLLPVTYTRDIRTEHTHTDRRHSAI